MSFNEWWNLHAPGECQVALTGDLTLQNFADHERRIPGLKSKVESQFERGLKPFYLGKGKDSRGWSLSPQWLFMPDGENLAKFLNGACTFTAAELLELHAQESAKIRQDEPTDPEIKWAGAEYVEENGGTPKEMLLRARRGELSPEAAEDRRLMREQWQT